jgi:hypothetical protein
VFLWSGCNDEHCSISMIDMLSCKWSIGIITIDWLNHCNHICEWLQLSEEHYWNCNSDIGSVEIDCWNYCSRVSNRTNLHDVIGSVETAWILFQKWWLLKFEVIIGLLKPADGIPKKLMWLIDFSVQGIFYLPNVINGLQPTCFFLTMVLTIKNI